MTPEINDFFGRVAARGMPRLDEAAADIGDFLRRRFMNSSTAGKPIPSVNLVDRAGPGVTPVTTVLNRPGTAGIKPPAIQAGGPLKGLGGRILGPLIYGPQLYTGTKEVIESIGRGEGYGAIPGLVGDLFSGPKATSPPGGRQYGIEENMPKPSGMYGGVSGDIPLDQYPAGIPRPGNKGVVDAAPSLSIPPSISETDKGKGPKGNEVGTKAPVTDEDEAMRIWARTHGKLADRVIDRVQSRREKDPTYTQSGYEAILGVRQPNSLEVAQNSFDSALLKDISPLSEEISGKSYGFDDTEAVDFQPLGDMEPMIDAQSFLSGKMSDIMAKSSKPSAETGSDKPLTVPMNQIPANLADQAGNPTPEGEEYLRMLDAGLLTQ